MPLPVAFTWDAFGFYQGALVIDDLFAGLVPAMHRSRETGFNVFDVMHYGTHEKQLSDVFAWLLDVGGSHALGGLFQRIFITEVNRNSQSDSRFGAGPYTVRQEVNTAGREEGADIADLVLESDDSVIVVENFETSDGHGHSFQRYRQLSESAGRGGVVLLCRYRNSALQTDGWQNATVVTYDVLLEQLHEAVLADRTYQRKHSDAFSFIAQMHRKFAQGRVRMDDDEVLEFITLMCTTGEAERYGEKSPDGAARRFATDVSAAAVERFGDGHELLQHVKAGLKAFCAHTLQHQLNGTLGDGFVEDVSARFAGIYQWTINFTIRDELGDFGEAPLQLKFGPSARHAIAADANWVRKMNPSDADYAHLFITRAATREIRQSAVTMQQVLAGLGSGDRRLHDEICDLMSSASRPTL